MIGRDSYTAFKCAYTCTAAVHIYVHVLHTCICALLLICPRGSGFRESFSRLGGLLALSKAPLTASAPPHVEAEILSSLHMHDPVFVSQPLNRPNIYIHASASRSVGELDHGHCVYIHVTCHAYSTVHVARSFCAARLSETSTHDIYC